MNGFKILVLCLATAFCALGAEGFNHQKQRLPLFVQSVWESTFSIIPKTKGIAGTAFIVRKVPGKMPNHSTLFLLTNSHLILPNCGKKIGLCENIRLTSSLAYDISSKNYIQTDTNERTFDNVNVVRISDTNDLALISVEVETSKHYHLQPVFLETNCDSVTKDLPVYMIGYPNPSLRPFVPGVSDQNKFYLLKRWSVGKIYQLTLYSQNGPLTATTNDSLPGNSGGPVVTADGRVIGVVTGSVQPVPGQYTYLGGADSSPHGVFESCSAVNSFRKL